MLLAAALAWAAMAAGPAPQSAPDQRPRIEGQAGGVRLSAAFHYRALSHGGRSYFLDQHLVVEVGLSSPALKRLKLAAGQFHLRVNGGKAVLAAQPANLVAYSMRWRWSDRGVQAQAGPVILGGPPNQPRFPGDRIPAPLPRAPESRPPGAPEPPEAQSLGEILAQAALPEGDLLLPVSGCLYYPYEKKIKSIKKLELVYQGPEAAITLRLR